MTFPATPRAVIGSIISAREEHHSGELMGGVKKGKSIIILTILKGRGDQLKENLLGLGQSLVPCPFSCHGASYLEKCMERVHLLTAHTPLPLNLDFGDFHAITLKN